MKKRVGIFTATRAEYGLLAPLMRRLAVDPDFHLQLYVSGAHLASAFGETWRDIEKDGFTIDALLPLPMRDGSPESLAAGMAEAGAAAAKAFASLRPDILILLGDRYELLPVASTALIMGVPLAHIAGGDITEGAIDDAVRHAVTKLAALHFPGSREARARLLQLGEAEERVVLAGQLGLDNLMSVTPPSREHLARELDLDPARPWGLLTWHPETRSPAAKSLEDARALVAALLTAPPWRTPPGMMTEQRQDADTPKEGNLQILATYANADPGGREINAFLEETAARHPGVFFVRENLGMRRYVGMLHAAAFMAGNSSSGIFEAPCVRLPTLNIGDRQKGRFLAPNIVQCAASREAIAAGLAALQTEAFAARNRDFASPYGDGHAAGRIHAALRAWMLTEKQAALARKPFVTLPPFREKCDVQQCL